VYHRLNAPIVEIIRFIEKYTDPVKRHILFEVPWIHFSEADDPHTFYSAVDQVEEIEGGIL
jgi:hypothetical protein